MIRLGGELIDLTGNNDKDIKKLRDVVYKLKEDLQYYLEHIDESNLTSDFGTSLNAKVVDETVYLK